MKTWAERTQGRPGFADVWRTAMAIRDARAQREQNQWQFDKAKESYDRQQDFNTLLAGPNPEEARLADPVAYERWNQAQNAAKVEAQKNALEMRKTESGIAKDQREIADKRLAATQTAQQFMTSALQANPAAIGTVRQRRDDLVRQGLIDHFNLPGEDSAVDTDPKTGQPIQTWVQSEPTQKQIEVGQRMAGVEEPKLPTSAQEYEYAKTHPGYDEREIALARAKGVNVNVGDHPLPANQISEIADFNTAIDTLSGLAGDFKKLVPADDIVSQMRARGEALIPNTKVDQYNAMVLRAQQIVGLILENGKLVGQDEAKYRRMLPAPGDSYDMVQMKINGLMRDLEIKGRNRADAYSQGGYRVPKVRSATPTQALDGGGNQVTREQQITKRMAEMQGVPPAQQIANLKNEGLFTEQQAAEALRHIGGQ